LFLLLVAALVLLVPAGGHAAGAPAIAFVPSPYDYGTIDANTTASQTFTLTNSGTKATGMLSVSLTGSSAFSSTADTCTATSLGPNKSCTVTVQYAPTTAGSSDSGTLSARSKKPGASTSASLTGSSSAADTLTVDNPNVSCAAPIAGPLIQGDLGETISFSAAFPIDFVSVTLGAGAFVVSAQFDTTAGQITLSENVTSYVVWTCPPSS